MQIDKRILANLIPGLLPLFVFLFLEEIFGMVPALIGAIITGIAGFFISYIRTGRFERLILIDIALLIVLSGISLISGNGIYFKLKPAFIELVFAAVLGYSGYSGRNLLMEMSGRYLNSARITREFKDRMTGMVRAIFWIIILHSIMVVYAALMLSDRAWVFISGILFYLILAAYFGFEWIRSRRAGKKFKAQEILPIVDEDGRITGRIPRNEAHFNKNGKILHPVVHLHVFDEKGRIFLQHRPEWKEIAPGKWDTAVGGHLSYGDTVETGLLREAWEELGIRVHKPVFLGKYLWETAAEKELVYMFSMITNQTPRINKKELEGGRFWEFTEINKNKDTGLFTDSFLHEYSLLEKARSLR